MHNFTEEEIEFIRVNAPGTQNKILTEMFNTKFNLKLTQLQIENCKTRNGIKSGLTGWFEKGSIPFNKGTKGLTRRNKTSFKKGQLNGRAAQLYKPVGSERITKDGYTAVKVKDPNIWGLKHVVEWEKANGPVPKKHTIVFADGNKNNFNLDNLICISRSQLLIMNQNKLFNEYPDYTKTGVLIAKVIDKANKKTKEMKKIEK